MNAIIDAAFSRTRTVITLFVMILLAGTSAYLSIPKEAEPDIPIPIIYVSASYDGISPEDAERLLVKPLEKELQSIEGVKTMTSNAAEGYASVVLEFDAGFDADQALLDVREKTDAASDNLPDTVTPHVNEINTALFPVLTLVLSGDVPERALIALAKRLRDEIEGLPGVLEVDLGGDREEMLEVTVDAQTLEAYQISFAEVAQFVSQNNRLVAPGALDTGAGRLVFKVPGIIEGIEDLMTLPIKVDGAQVVTFSDVAEIRRTYKDADGYARLGGEGAVSLEIKKRSGANIIATIESIRTVMAIAQTQPDWPTTVQVSYLQDKSDQIKTMLGDLENNVVTAIVLVMVIVVFFLGGRSSLLVGLAIPGSFLAGMVVLQALGFTLNIVVLFSLILVVGMLVDGAIVTVELADRKLAAGAPPKVAYADAAKRMTWPIIASTATTLTVFMPLTVWPGIVGEFMKFLPMTVIITLAASLLMALVFIPVLGAALARFRRRDVKPVEDIAESGSLYKLSGFTGGYVRVLGVMVNHPVKVFLALLLGIAGTYASYGVFGRGVEFFPSIEPEFLQVQVQARGDFSIQERDALVRRVEATLLDAEGLKTVYARTTSTNSPGSQLPADAIGVIQLELLDWQVRPPASEIIPKLRAAADLIPGIQVQIREQESGPGGGKPINLELSGLSLSDLETSVGLVRDAMERIDGLVDIEDSRPLPSIEWRLEVDREQAAQYGANVTLLGSSVQMMTSGILLTDYTPDDSEDEIEVRLRFPEYQRDLGQLSRLRVPTAYGAIPVENFVTLKPADKTGQIERADARRIMTIQSGVVDGVLPAKALADIQAALDDVVLPQGIRLTFKGENEDQAEAGAFLGGAFATAILAMLVILLTQFNSFYQAFLVMSAIVFSTAGVLLGLMVTGQPFGIVMGGIGVIALAGIVVNNNIVLIDTYNEFRQRFSDPREAILRTAAQRMRPVLLTSVTTVLGLMPMVFALTIDIFDLSVLVGAPSSQWWTQLSSAIAGGLTFATVLTLFLTPCLLMLGARFGR